MDALSGPADVSTDRVECRVKATVLDSIFADPQETKEPKGKGCPGHQTIEFIQGGCLQPLQHVTQHFQSQWQSCRLVVNGSLEALETLDGKSQHRLPGSRTLVPKGVV